MGWATTPRPTADIAESKPEITRDVHVERGRTPGEVKRATGPIVEQVIRASTFHDYESLGCNMFARATPVVLESYAGTQVVQWHGRIERQLVNLLGDADKGRNWDYANKIREYLKIWRNNELTGSINRETLDTLKASADILAVDSWNLASYFSNLRDQLRVLVASEEELPRGMDMNQNDPMAGPSGAGGGGGAPPMSPSFGPDKDMPSGMGGPEGDLGAAGGEPGAEGDLGAGPEGEPGAEGSPEGNKVNIGEPPKGDEKKNPEDDLAKI